MGWLISSWWVSISTAGLLMGGARHFFPKHGPTIGNPSNMHHVDRNQGRKVIGKGEQQQYQSQLGDHLDPGNGDQGAKPDQGKSEYGRQTRAPQPDDGGTGEDIGDEIVRRILGSDPQLDGPWSEERSVVIGFLLFRYRLWDLPGILRRKIGYFLDSMKYD